MTPLEAGIGHGQFESFFGTAREARLVAPKQLIVVAALDEAYAEPDEPIERFDDDVRNMEAAAAEARERDVNISFVVWDYFVREGSELIDRIVPFGRVFPQFDYLNSIPAVRDLVTGEIQEHAGDWITRLDFSRKVPLGVATQVIIYNDISGSMTRDDWFDVPLEFVAQLKVDHPGILAENRFIADEKWADWFRGGWDLYKLAHLGDF